MIDTKRDMYSGICIRGIQSDDDLSACRYNLTLSLFTEVKLSDDGHCQFENLIQLSAVITSCFDFRQCIVERVLVQRCVSIFFSFFFQISQLRFLSLVK